MKWIVFLVISALPMTAMAEEALRTITVGGEGSVSAAPDLADVTLGVETRARSARDALTANSEEMAAVMSRLERLGIPPEDMQTTELSLYPDFENRHAWAPAYGCWLYGPERAIDPNSRHCAGGRDPG